jgi:hypothetical protein
MTCTKSQLRKNIDRLMLRSAEGTRGRFRVIHHEGTKIFTPSLMLARWNRLGACLLCERNQTGLGLTSAEKWLSNPRVEVQDHYERIVSGTLSLCHFRVVGERPGSKAPIPSKRSRSTTQLLDFQPRESSDKY